MSEQQQEYGGIIINGIDCSGGGGSSVTPNPPAPATETLSSLDINGVVYGIEQETRENIFSIFDTFIKNSQYSTNSTFTPNVSFNFNSNDYVDNWSTNATIFNNNAFDLTDCDKLEIIIDITEQADYGYFWVTLSQTKYTWGTSEWPGLYDNIDSVLQISQSGSYTIDVSELTGNYYIYLGTTTGKTSTTHGGGCDNTKNGKIIGIVSEFYTVSKESSGTEVIANPTETPTDTLNTISIDGTVYEIEGGGSGGEGTQIDVLFSKTPDNIHEPTITLSNSLFDYDMIIIDYVYVGNNTLYHIGHSYMTDDLNIGDNIGFESGSGNTWYSISNNTTLTLTQSQTTWCVVSVIGTKYESGGSGGSVVLKEGEYANFTNVGYIALPFTLNSDYILEVDYEATVNRNNNSVIGLSNGSTGLIHLTQWNNQWAHGTGTSETFYSDPQGMTSRHIYKCNYNGYNYLDSSEMSTFTPSTDSTVYYHIGSRGTGNLYTGKIYSYKLTSISTDDVIIHLKPMKLMAGKVILKEGLYDLVNGNFYSCNGMTIVGTGGGSTVIGTYIEPNSEEEPTETLENIKIDDTVYNVGSGNVDDVYVNGESVLDSNKIAQVKTHKEISLADYEDANDDIIYFVDDDDDELGIYYSPIIYSTEEREVGTWTDGKPLYQKTLTIPLSNVSDWTLVDDTISYDKLIQAVGTFWEDGENGDQIGHSSARDETPRLAVKTDHKLYYFAANISTGRTFKYDVTIQYTKTTDTPGSAKYNALGVPMVHYSTDEHVIGTWIDGKPLYQKTYYYDNQSGLIDGDNKIIQLDSAINVTKLNGFLVAPDSNKRWILPYSKGSSTTAIIITEDHYINLYVSNDSWASTRKVYITIEYTKTMD